MLFFQIFSSTDLLDVVICLALVVGLKGGFASEELEAEDADGPEIDSCSVRLACHHLGRQVVQRAAHRVSTEHSNFDDQDKNIGSKIL